MKKCVEELFVKYMPTIVGAKIISNKSILLKNKTKNCFSKNLKHQECGV
jgi:hypothetical protein